MLVSVQMSESVRPETILVPGRLENGASADLLAAWVKVQASRHHSLLENLNINMPALRLK